QTLPGGGGYELHFQPGLHTPLGPLPGADGDTLAQVTAYGDFKFEGITCKAPDGDWFDIPAQSDLSGWSCRPEHVALLFSAPVKPEVLQSMTWQTRTEKTGWQPAASSNGVIPAKP